MKKLSALKFISLIIIMLITSKAFTSEQNSTEIFLLEELERNYILLLTTKERLALITNKAKSCHAQINGMQGELLRLESKKSSIDSRTTINDNSSQIKYLTERHVVLVNAINECVSILQNRAVVDKKIENKIYALKKRVGYDKMRLVYHVLDKKYLDEGRNEVEATYPCLKNSKANCKKLAKNIVLTQFEEKNNISLYTTSPINNYLFYESKDKINMATDFITLRYTEKSSIGHTNQLVLQVVLKANFTIAHTDKQRALDEISLYNAIDNHLKSNISSSTIK